MRKHELYTDYNDYFEYFGNTEIEGIRKQGEKTIVAMSYQELPAVSYFPERFAISLFYLFYR